MVVNFVVGFRPNPDLNPILTLNGPLIDALDVNKTSCYKLNDNPCTTEACVTDNYYAREISMLVELYNTDGWNAVNPAIDTEVKSIRFVSI